MPDAILMKHWNTPKPILCTIGDDHQFLAKEMKKLGATLAYFPEKFQFTPKKLVIAGFAAGRRFSDTDVMRYAFLEAELLKHFRNKGKTESDLAPFFRALKGRVSLREMMALSAACGVKTAGLRGKDLLEYVMFTGPAFLAGWIKKNKALSP